MGCGAGRDVFVLAPTSVDKVRTSLMRLLSTSPVANLSLGSVLPSLGCSLKGMSGFFHDGGILVSFRMKTKTGVTVVLALLVGTGLVGFIS